MTRETQKIAEENICEHHWTAEQTPAISFLGS